jgi:UDP-N-acetylglucosamine/UDP-N-acetylgalactosamine diphosphorylase
VLRWWDHLETRAREHLLAEIEAIPWDQIESLIDTHICNKPPREPTDGLEPPPFYPCSPGPEQEELYQEALEIGDGLIRSGRVCAFTVAGGQASRLGFDGPKGAVAVSPIQEKSLFQLFAETIKAVQKRYQVKIRWYIMTNPTNHQQTKGFLKDHDHFGLPEDHILCFPQGTLPSFDFDGKMLMSGRNRLALAPNGHGGSLAALYESGALENMKSSGIEVISYFQVDNPLVKPFDPLFIGLHNKTQSEMSTKVARKIDALEKVGNLCLRKGKLQVVEYSDFPEELAHKTNGDGRRTFDLGNLAIHLMDVDFVERLASRGDLIRYHRAEKKIAWLDDNGFQRTPTEPNGVKLESFVFDVLPLAKSAILLEVNRAEEFAPVKNPSGVDSVESAIAAQLARAADWLECAGIHVPRDEHGKPLVRLEIAPSYALDREDVRTQIWSNPEFLAGETIYIS